MCKYLDGWSEQSEAATHCLGTLCRLKHISLSLTSLNVATTVLVLFDTQILLATFSTLLHC